MLHKWQIANACNKLKLKSTCGYALSPIILPGKKIVFNTQAWGNKLVKINQTGKILAVNDEFRFHHKVHLDSSGDIYATMTIKNSRDDSALGVGQGIAVLDQNLEIKSHFLIHKIYNDLNLSSRLYSANSSDPIHINDVDVLDYQGDKILLVNLRSPSSVLAYNLTRDFPMWILDGFTKQGHDVDVISTEPFAISLFDNNVYTRQENIKLDRNKSFGNKVVIVKGLPLDIKQDEFRIFTQIDIQNGVLSQKVVNFDGIKSPPKTISAGLSEYNYLTNSFIVEESNHGRLFSYNLDRATLEWQFINKNEDGSLFGRMSWSSFYNKNPLIN